MAKQRRSSEPAARGRQTGELSWSFRARGRGPSSRIGAWFALVLAALAGLVGTREDGPPPAQPAGGVVEEGVIEGVDYQIRRARAGGYQGWVVIDGQWSPLEGAQAPKPWQVREQIKAFATMEGGRDG